MSYASLAAVAGLSQTQTQKIITDIFQSLIELSRRTQKEAKIRLGNCGSLVVTRSRELAFYPAEKADESEIWSSRTFVRDEISMIDQASAVLSMGGGKSFSVRSSRVSKPSMLTPVTHLSQATSLFTESKQSTRHSSPKSVAKSVRSKRNCATLQSLERERETEKSSGDKKQVPWPFLQEFMNEQTKASKKVVFDHSDFNDLAKTLQNQISEKAKAKEETRIEEFNQHLQETTRWRQKLYEEQQNLARDRI